MFGDKELSKTIERLRMEGIKYAPDSSTIKLVTFAPYENVLIVDFKSNSSYLYFGVTEEMFSELKVAESAGRYCAYKIKPLKCIKLDKEAEVEVC